MEAVKCEAFLAAAELGSLTATAELLGYTQSGVTRMIGTLEEELGFPLFLRSKKGVQLTENGNQHADHAKTYKLFHQRLCFHKALTS